MRAAYIAMRALNNVGNINCVNCSIEKTICTKLTTSDENYALTI